LSPEELLLLAENIGLYAVALTDHDTVMGIGPAMEAARGKSVRFVPGVEISGEIDSGALHILGLFVDHENVELNKMLSFAEEQRYQRNVQIAARLQALGFSITIEEVAEVAGRGSMGRPHFASVMMAKGYAATMSEAFLKYLAKGGAAFVPKVRIPRKKAIEVIVGASGIPVLAHPDQTHRGGKELDALLEELRALGLMAMETYYSGYPPTRSRKYRKTANRLNLLESGGSDFHGSVKPGISLGTGPGNLNVPDEIYDRLAKAAKVR
jgi:predicted metal-dependent phosphoesterase TrpH